MDHWLGIGTAPKQTVGPGLLVAGQPVNRSVWLGVGATAWAYFQPGVGVDSNTGLPYADGNYFKAFSAWDLGVYIQAVIDAQELGLVSVGGPWGSSDRLARVVDFLENESLNASSGYPYWYYNATNGEEYASLSNQAASPVNLSDIGRLFIALNNLRNYNTSLT